LGAGDDFRQRVGDRRHFGPLTAAGIYLVAAARVDQDRVIVSANDVGVELKRYTVEFVSRDLTAPKCFRNDAEHGAAVPPVDRIAYEGQFEIAHLCGAKGRNGWQHSTFDEFAAAFEEVCGIVYQLTAAFEHVPADICDVLIGGFHRLPASLGL